jgi:hypothetical protein
MEMGNGPRGDRAAVVLDRRAAGGQLVQRRASCTKLAAALGSWKPTRSAPSSPSTIAERQGSWVNSS